METGEGGGERPTRRRQAPPPTSVDAGRWSPAGGEKLTKGGEGELPIPGGPAHDSGVARPPRRPPGGGANGGATGSGSPGQRLPDQEAWEIESWARWAPWAARPAPALRSVPAALPDRSGARGSSLPPRGPTLPQATPLHPGPPGRPATQLAQEQACVEV